MTVASVDELSRAVQRSEIVSEPVEVEFGGTSWFGPNRDVPVRLVLPGRVSELHRSLANQLESLPGFAADEPAYWREGYRPHVTLTPKIATEEGERRSLCSVAIAQLERDGATVGAALELR